MFLPVFRNGSKQSKTVYYEIRHATVNKRVKDSAIVKKTVNV